MLVEAVTEGGDQNAVRFRQSFGEFAAGIAHDVIMHLEQAGARIGKLQRPFLEDGGLHFGEV